MRKQIAAGNWKMNTSHEEGLMLARAISHADIPEDVEVILATPFTHLKAIVDATFPVPRLHIAAQNMATEKSGAYTGEISAEMLKSIFVSHVLIGHSERRSYYQEDADILNAKMKMALENGLVPIYCCGEPLEIRKADTHVDYVTKQLEDTILTLDPSDFSKLILAYEPIWAIGTGETASPEQAQEMHAAIRECIEKKYGADLAEEVSILYGGSVKPANAKEIFSKPDVDGGLVGGASLKANDFITIIQSF